MRDLTRGERPCRQNSLVVVILAIKDHGQMRSGERPRDEAMSPGVKYVFEDETAQASADSMRGLQVRRLPVLNLQKRLVETVSLGDLPLKSHCPPATTLKQISKPHQTIQTSRYPSRPPNSRHT